MQDEYDRWPSQLTTRSSSSATSRPSIQAAPVLAGLLTPHFCIGYYAGATRKLHWFHHFVGNRQVPLHLDQVSPLPLRRLWLVPL